MIILILEDDERQAVALKNIITDYKKNWIIYTTQTYEEALYTCAKFPIDIFLLDIELGKKSDKNGFDFAKEIRMMNKYTNIPIIFITGKNRSFRLSTLFIVIIISLNHMP